MGEHNGVYVHMDSGNIHDYLVAQCCYVLCLIKKKHRRRNGGSWALTINITHPPCVAAALS